MMRRTGIACGFAFALGVIAGCSNRGDVLPASGERAEQASTVAVDDGVPDELAVRDWSAFGMPVPEGAAVDEIGRTHAHYRIGATMDEVLAFYAAQLPDFASTRYDQGVKLEAQDRSDRALYVYEEDGDVLLTYFDETPEAPADPNLTAGGAPAVEPPAVAPDGVTMVLSTNRSHSGRRVTGTFGGTRNSGGSAADGTNGSQGSSAGTGGAGSRGGAAGPGTGGASAGGSAAGGSAGPSAGGLGGSPSSADFGGGPTVQPTTHNVTRPAGGYNRGFGVDSRPRQIDFVHSDYQRPSNPDAYY